MNKSTLLFLIAFMSTSILMGACIMNGKIKYKRAEQGDTSGLTEQELADHTTKCMESFKAGACATNEETKYKRAEQGDTSGLSDQELVGHVRHVLDTRKSSQLYPYSN